MEWNGHKCGKVTVMGIAREQSVAQIMIGKKTGDCGLYKLFV